MVCAQFFIPATLTAAVAHRRYPQGQRAPASNPNRSDVRQEVKDALRKFRFKRRTEGNGALEIKINKAQLTMEVVEEYDAVSIEELAEELPANSPRYVLLTYELKHKDGRTSWPLVLLDWKPMSSEIGMLTLHASALLDFQSTADVSKVIELRDGSEGLTTEIIDAKLLAA